MPMEDWNSPGPVAGIQTPTLDWSQDILEPRKQVWRPAAREALAMPHQTLKSVVKTPGKPAPVEPASCAKVKPWIKLALVEPASCAKVKPWIKQAPAELASCGKGRDRVIAEKLQAMTGMGPAAASQYSGDEESRKKKQVSKKPTFPTLEDIEARRGYEEHKNWVINHQKESVGECYTSIK